MKARTKKLLGLLLTGTMAVSMLAGCGSEGTQEQSAEKTEESVSAEASTPESSEEVVEEAEDFSGTITISVPARAGAQAGWEAVRAAYNEMHPNVDIVIDLKASDGYYDWITNLSNVENPEVDIAEFYGGGFDFTRLLDYSDYLDLDSPYSDGTWAEQFDSSGLTPSTSGTLDQLSLASTQVMWMYNIEIFDEVGVKAPETWDELVEVCEKLQAAGYQPITIDGDFNSFNTMTMGWLAQIYTDQTTRSLINVYGAKEGDFCYDPDVDGVWEYDPADPWNDTAERVNQNIVRVLAACKDGTYSMNTPGLKTVWENFAKVFPEYAGGEAMFGTNCANTATVFYQGKAAMMINGGWGIIEFMRTMEELEEAGYYTDEDGNQIEGTTFTLGTFAMPNMEGEGIEADVRTIEVPVQDFSVLSKDQEHNEMVMDFIMYYSSVEGMSIYLDALLKAGGTIDGPSYVYGVEYPEEIASAFENVEYIGNAQQGYGSVFATGVPYIDESKRDFYNNSYDYFMGNITVDQLLERAQESMDKYLPSLMAALNISDKDLENPAAAPAGN